MSKILYCSLDEAFGNYNPMPQPQPPPAGIGKGPEWQYGLTHNKQEVVKTKEEPFGEIRGFFRNREEEQSPYENHLLRKPQQQQQKIVVEKFSEAITCNDFMAHYKQCNICRNVEKIPVVTNYKDLMILMALGIFIIVSLDKMKSN